MSTHKRVIDWIKLKNIREQTKNNYSALKGLRRVNNLLYKTLKYGFILTLVCFGGHGLYRRFNDTMENGIKEFENKINDIYDKKRLYLQKHRALMLDYSAAKEVDAAENKIGITYYREKLVKNASGTVLETCK